MIRPRFTLLVLILCLFAGFNACYVIVPVINFGHLTIPQGDTGFLNKYESQVELGASGEIQGVTKTQQGLTVKDLIF